MNNSNRFNSCVIDTKRRVFGTSVSSTNDDLEQKIQMVLYRSPESWNYSEIVGQ